MPCDGGSFHPMRIAVLGCCLVPILCCAGLSAEAIRLVPSNTGLVLDLLPEQETGGDLEPERSPAAPQAGRGGYQTAPSGGAVGCI